MSQKRKLVVMLIAVIVCIGGSLSACTDVTKVTKDNFNESTFHLGKWNGIYVSDEKETFEMNFIGITTEEQVDFLIKNNVDITVTSKDNIALTVGVEAGDKIDIEGKKYQILNLISTFDVNDLLKNDGHIQEIEVKLGLDLIAKNDVGAITLLEGIQSTNPDIGYEGYNITYPDIDFLSVEFMNDTLKNMNVTEIGLENLDLDYEINGKTPFVAKPGEPVKVDVSLNPKNDLDYDFWVVTPYVLHDGTKTYLTSTFHKSLSLSEETIKKILTR